MVSIPASAAAQPAPHRVAVGGTLALGSSWDDESRVGDGVSVGGAVQVGPWKRVAIEIDVRHFTYDRRFQSGVEFSGEGEQLSANLLYYLREAGTRPFVLVGVALLRVDRTTRFPLLPPFPRPGTGDASAPIIAESLRSSDTGTGVDVGGGVSVPLGAHWSLRPEIRALLGAGAIVSRIDVGAGLSYGW